MCGLLESIHQVRAPPAQWAQLEVPLETAVRGGAVILADDREANKAWCVDRQELFLYLTSQLLQDKHSWTHRPGVQESDVCTVLLAKSILGLPDSIRAMYRGVGRSSSESVQNMWDVYLQELRFAPTGVRERLRAVSELPWRKGHTRFHHQEDPKQRMYHAIVQPEMGPKS